MKDAFLDQLRKAKTPIPDREGEDVSLVLLLTHHSASRMWQWHDLSGKPPWHSATKITPAHALAWWVAEHGLDLSPEDRMRLDASSAAMVHCSTGDPLPPHPSTPGPG
eukprot:5842766-Amphidinium_carterae.1